MAELREITPTPSALLELREERQVVGEGYRFLDEKRLLLAAEVLRQLEAYQGLHREFITQRQQALSTLTEAVARHGIQGLEVYPPLSMAGAEVHTETQVFLGVPLQKSRMELPTAPPSSVYRPIDPSPEAQRCALAFRELTVRAARLAALAGNLERLLVEYRKTERRARALEDVIMPELDNTITDIATRLEELDQEEAVRTHLKY